MSNDSTTAGYLVPVGAAPSTDLTLDEVIQAYVVGVTGMAGAMVRPRWTPIVPKQPEPNIDWCAIGVIETNRDKFATIVHSNTDAQGGGNGSDTLYRNEELTILASFYGPDAMANATLLADGAQINQNNATLELAGLALIECDQIRAAPELFNQQWVRRYDISLRVRRMISRTYQILNVLSGEITLETENRSIPITVTNPEN